MSAAVDLVALLTGSAPPLSTPTGSALDLASAPYADLVARCPGRTLQRRRAVMQRLLNVRHAIDIRHGVDCDLTALARLIAMSPTHLLRLYRRVFDMSPFEHATQRRLSAICWRLTSSRDAISEIGRRYGFDNPTCLSRAFRAHFGLSPRELRARLAPGARGTTPRAPAFDSRLTAVPAGVAASPEKRGEETPWQTH
jgi:transcriptional regulator GlxA family with amidase domain